MAVPKRKTSKSKKRMRRHAKNTIITASVNCTECGEPRLPHRVCPKCGYYRGKQVITVDAS